MEILTFNEYLELWYVDPIKVEEDLWVPINEILRKSLAQQLE